MDLKKSSHQIFIFDFDFTRVNPLKHEYINQKTNQQKCVFTKSYRSIRKMQEDIAASEMLLTL